MSIKSGANLDLVEVKSENRNTKNLEFTVHHEEVVPQPQVEKPAVNINK